MKKTICILVGVVLLSSFTTAIEHYYNLELKYSYGNISVKSIDVKPKVGELKNRLGGFDAKIISFDDKVLDTVYFSIPLEIFYDTVDPETGKINGGGSVILNETNINLQLPYYEDVKKIEIYDKESNKKLTIDVSPYSKTVQENVNNSIIQKNISIEDISKGITIEKVNENKFYIGLFIFIVLLVIAITWRKFRK